MNREELFNTFISVTGASTAAAKLTARNILEVRRCLCTSQPKLHKRCMATKLSCFLVTLGPSGDEDGACIQVKRCKALYGSLGPGLLAADQQDASIAF